MVSPPPRAWRRAMTFSYSYYSMHLFRRQLYAVCQQPSAYVYASREQMVLDYQLSWLFLNIYVAICCLYCTVRILLGYAAGSPTTLCAYIVHRSLFGNSLYSDVHRYNQWCPYNELSYQLNSAQPTHHPSLRAFISTIQIKTPCLISILGFFTRR